MTVCTVENDRERVWKEGELEVVVEVVENLKCFSYLQTNPRMLSKLTFVKVCVARKATVCLSNGLFMNSLGGAAFDQQIYDKLNQLVSQCTTNLKFDACSFWLQGRG